MQRVLVAPASFKGSADAAAAARALAAGVARADAGARLTLVPIADGGEGTARILAGPAAQRLEVATVDAYGRPKHGVWWYRDGSAFVDVAEGSGYVAPAARPANADGEAASSYGSGVLVRAALADPRVTTVWLGLGGSGFSDGGAGFLEALGWRLWDARRRPLQGLNGRLLPQVAAVEPGPWPTGKRLVGLFDVAVPLTGPQGAARMFGPQKGVTDPPAMDRVLEAWGRLLADGRFDPATVPGAGAAGGLGTAVLALGQQLAAGAEMVLDLLDIDGHLAAADWCLTGEGKLDAQSLHGKAPLALARRARRHRVPVVAVVGQRELDEDAPYRAGLTGIYPLHAGPVDPAAALVATEDRLWRAAYHVAQWMRACSPVGSQVPAGKESAHDSQVASD